MKERRLRPPSDGEAALLRRLTNSEFPGSDVVRHQIDQVLVETIDDNGSLRLVAPNKEMAPVVKRIPVEAESEDEDGVHIHMLLHVVNGLVDELQFYKDDSSAIMRMPPPESWDIIVLG